MYVDKLISDSRPPDHHASNLDKEELVLAFERYLSEVQGDYLYVFLPPWNNDVKFVRRLKSYVLKTGNTFLTYDFPSEILSSNTEMTVYAFEEIEQTVRKDIKELVEENEFSNVILMASSLGCVHACMIADDNPLVDEMILVVPGHSLAESTWKGYRTQFLRKQLEDKGYDLSELKQEWSSLAPINNIGFKGDKIRIYLSQADIIIPYDNGKRLVEEMFDEGLNPEVHVNRFLGHYLTALRFLYFPSFHI